MSSKDDVWAACSKDDIWDVDFADRLYRFRQMDGMTEQKFREQYFGNFTPEKNMLEQENVKWFIEVNGQRKGPYPSQDAANAAMLAEGLNGNIVPETQDGKQFLMG